MTPLHVASEIGRNRVRIGSQIFRGQSISFLVSSLRETGHTLPSNTSDQEDFFKSLGFLVSREANPPKKFSSDFIDRKICAVCIPNI